MSGQLFGEVGGIFYWDERWCKGVWRAFSTMLSLPRWNVTWEWIHKFYISDPLDWELFCWSSSYYILTASSIFCEYCGREICSAVPSFLEHRFSLKSETETDHPYPSSRFSIVI